MKLSFQPVFRWEAYRWHFRI